MQAIHWQDVPEEAIKAGMTRRMVNTGSMTVAKIKLSRGTVVPLHHHTNEQITMVESGRLLFRVDGQEVTVEPGQLLEIPPDLPHEVEALEDSLATDLFSPPRQDWIDGDDAYLRKGTATASRS